MVPPPRRVLPRTRRGGRSPPTVHGPPVSVPRRSRIDSTPHHTETGRTIINSTDPGANLVPLSQTDQTIANPDLDVRGRDVITTDEEKVGTVEEILIDQEQLHARFLRVSSGGFLDIGQDHFLVPVDVITGTDTGRVRIDRDRAAQTDVPAYDPDLVPEPAYYRNLYLRWGAPPYWGPGYVYPGYVYPYP